MALSQVSEELLDLSRVEDLPSVFAIGCFARRVTFADQQTRALNLVWSLFETKRLRKGDRVAIVGAGLAGLTAAVATTTLGCRTAIIDRHDSVMSLQRGNLTRYIHPNIYDWPAPEAYEPTTHFPFLNWTANYAGEVVNQVEEEWTAVAKGVETLFGYEISELQTSKGVAWLRGEDPRGRRGPLERGFECVILANGFGLERDVFGVGHRSYWTTDDLHQPVVHSNRPLNVIVSGNGDGGLVDTLRLRLRDFLHAEIASSLLSGDILREIRAELTAIESALAGKSDVDAASHLWREYQRLKIPRPLVTAFKNRCRTDTTIVLNGMEDVPLNRNSAIINRFLVLLLLRTGNLAYMRGTLLKVDRSDDGIYEVTLMTPSGTKTAAYDLVVSRHGPRSVGNRLISERSAERLKLLRADGSKDDRLPAWPARYYDRVRRTSPKPAKRDRLYLKSVPIGIVLNGSAPYSFDMMNSFSERASSVLSRHAIKIEPQVVVGNPERSGLVDNQRTIRTLMTNVPKPRLIVTIGTNVSEAMVGLPMVPHIFIGVTDAVQSKLVANREMTLRSYERAGVQFPNLIAAKAKFMLDIMNANGLSTLGFISSREYPIDKAVYEKLLKAFEHLHESIRPRYIAIDDGKVWEAGFFTLDMYCGWVCLHFNLRRVFDVIPASHVFGGASEDVRNGAVGAVGPYDAEIGRVAAEWILAPHLIQGRPLCSIPIIQGSRQYCLNLKAVEESKLLIPSRIRRKAMAGLLGLTGAPSTG